MPRTRGKAPGRPVRILIVDDHPAVRDALAIHVAGENDLQVCGEAADPAEALRLVETARPDIAVIDVALKSGSGIDLIKRLRKSHENLLMIVWSMYSEELYAERALRAGARGYINKQLATRNIVQAIRDVLAGKVYLSPAMNAKLLEHHVGPARRESSLAPAEVLSDRQLDVFRLIGQGVKTSDIAARLHLSVHTVETYRERIRQKLHLKDGAELSRHAAQWEIENR